MDEPRSDDELGQTYDRRELLKRGVAVSAAAAVMGPSGAMASGLKNLAKQATPKPKRGGTLTIAAATGGTSDTFDPALGVGLTDTMRMRTHFDPLTRVAPHFGYEPGLAVKWTPNKDASVWEVRLRAGVHWHDGKPFTADDVIYTLRRMASPTHPGAAAVANVRLKDLKKLSPTLLRIPLNKPNGRLMDMFIFTQAASVVQNGAKDFSKPIGTGHFKLQSWTPGVQSVSVANRDYWDDPKPYVDKLVILGIADPTARFNALLSGQANACNQLSFAIAAANKTNPAIRLLVAESGPTQVFYFDVTKAPFDDVRVRQAMKLIVDRQQLIDLALNGYGIPANDVFGRRGMIDYSTSLPQRQQNIEQAKSLLKAAGRSDLSVTLHTAAVAPGVPQAAQVFAQQAKAAGVTINVQTEDSGAYFNTSLLYGKLPFAQDTWPVPALSYIYSTVLDPANVNNETHWNNPKSLARLEAAIGAQPGAKRKALWGQVQAEQYQQGGYIAWANRRTVDAFAPGIRGNKPGWAQSGNDHHWQNVWIA